MFRVRQFFVEVNPVVILLDIGSYQSVQRIEIAVNEHFGYSGFGCHGIDSQSFETAFFDNVINGFDQCQFRCLPVFDHLFFHCLMMLLLLGHKNMFPIGNIEGKKRIFIC
jgi:hypothetical protein